MQISLDVSYYPLKEDFVPPILDFIARLSVHPQLQVVSNGLSTQVFGEFDQVFDTVKEEIRKSFDLPHSVFVLKIVNADQSPQK